MAYVDGNKVTVGTGTWYVRLTVTESTSDATSVTYACTLQMYSNYGLDVNYNQLHICAGTSYGNTYYGTSPISSHYINFGYAGSGSPKTVHTWSVKIAKGTSAKTVYFQGSYYLCAVLTGTSNANLAVTVPALTSYTISYNANGGSGAPSAQTGYSGTALTLSSTKPTRTGYTFKGWSTSSSATTASYSAGGSYTPTSNVTLYAVWSVNAYTYTLGSATGATTTGSTASGSKNYGTTITLKGAANTGYTWSKWKSSNTSIRADITTASTTFSMPAGALTMTPVVTANTYTITYNANGGSGAPSATQYTYAASGTTNLSSTTPTRTGYTFLGWSTSSTATSASYSAGQAWNRSNASNYTLYAVWKINTWTVSYNANGGSGAPASQTKTYNVTLTLSSTKPTRTNYNFLGWSTSSTATSATYAAGGSYTANAAATLYAVWQLASKPPNAPTGVTATRNSDTSLTVSWTNNPPSAGGLTGTYVYVQVNDGSWSSNVNTTTSSTQTSMTYTSAANNKYYFRLMAYNGTGNSAYAYSSTVYTAPVAPTATGYKSDSTVRLTANGSSVRYLDHYVWQYSSDGGSTYATITGTGSSITHTTTVASPKYRVAAVNAGSLQSAWTYITPIVNKQIMLNIPDGKSFSDIYFYVPDGKSLSDIYIWV